MDFAPRYVANGVDDAFDLSSDRYDKIKQSIDQDIKNNKAQMVAEIIKAIDELQVMSEKQILSKEEFALNFRNIKALQQRGVEIFRPSISEVILNMNQKEFDHLKKYSADKLKMADERLLDQDDFLKHSFRSFNKTMDILFESTTDKQREIYRNFLAVNYPYYRAQIEIRKAYIDQFEAKFNDKQNLLELWGQMNSIDCLSDRHMQMTRRKLLILHCLSYFRAHSN